MDFIRSLEKKKVIKMRKCNRNNINFHVLCNTSEGEIAKGTTSSGSNYDTPDTNPGMGC